jgi:spore germination protein GerM
MEESEKKMLKEGSKNPIENLSDYQKYLVGVGIGLVVLAVFFSIGNRGIRSDISEDGLADISNTSSPEDNFVGDDSTVVMQGQEVALFNSVKIALIYTEVNGDIGCGDSVVMVSRDIEPTTAPLIASIKELLTVGYEDVTEYYNALAISTLEVDKITLSGGLATINLSGELLTGGICDNPRVMAQLETTAFQFPTVTNVDIFINGETLDEALSER